MAECTVTDDGVRLRAGPGLSAQILQELGAGTMVERRAGDAIERDGYRWQPVRYDGRDGYVAATLLDCDDGPTSVGGQCQITEAGVRLRAGPGLSAQILQELGAGTMVERRAGGTVEQDGYEWQPVRYDGRNGYIAATFLDCNLNSGTRIVTQFGRAPLDLSIGIRRNFLPAEHVRAAEVAHCESGWNTNAFANTSVERSRGYFQINGKAHPQWDSNAMFDPVQNCQAAGELFQQSGWVPWSCARTLGFV
jgi:uncharacterized protein YgiM (DUF1202 family)